MSSIKKVTLNKGDILYHEGESNSYGYIIDQGEVVLFHDKDGQRYDTERRGPGCILGELSILTGTPRAVSVEALTDCSLFQVPANRVLEHYRQLDPILRACVDTSITFAATLKENTLAKDPTTKSDTARVEGTLDDLDTLMDALHLEKDIEQGLKHGQFAMAFQPIVDIHTAVPVGFEALIRWTHPKRGFVPPNHFIELAETSDQINDITDFALMEACATLSRVRQLVPNGEALYASINISAKDVERKDFVTMVEYILDLNDLEPGCLKLEITETSLMPDSDVCRLNLAQLRALGCGISIDDFGTGYSNLTYLKSLPLTTLKIDRAFAGDAHQNPVSRSIVQMLIGLGGQLNVDVIAEGVETGADVQVLKELGCQYAQGFHFSRALPEMELLSFLGAQSTTVRRSA